MPRVSPDLSAPDWTQSLSSSLERASQAIGRLDARISVTYVAGSWMDRAALMGYAAARRAQGAELDEIDLFALFCDVQMPGRRRLAFAEDELAGLLAWRRILRRAGDPYWTAIVPSDAPSDWRERPSLLRALELMARAARLDATAAPWLGFPELLVRLQVTRSPLPCLVAADKAVRLTPADRDGIVRRYLKRLARAAEEGLVQLDALEAARRRASAVFAGLSRPARLPALAALLQHRPLVSPLQVSRALELTISGAGKLLARAAEAGLVVEISGRQAWKLYLTPELATSFGLIARPIGRPPALPKAEPLSPALEQFDAEMAAIDARLASLGVVFEQSASDDDALPA